jgi:hypothetical protein
VRSILRPLTVGVVTALALVALALIHAYWAFGGLWPAQSEPALVNTVVGITHAQAMPPRDLTLAVAAALLVASGFAFVRGVLGWQSGLWVRLPLAGLALIFAVRGIMAYLPGPLAGATEPFAQLNAYAYSPGILVLAMAFAYLAGSRR